MALIAIKIMYGLFAVPMQKHVQYSTLTNCLVIVTPNLPITFRQVSKSKDYYKYSFFPLAIVQNEMPVPGPVRPKAHPKTAVCKLQHALKPLPVDASCLFLI